jgi:hypothetical protein
MKYFFFAVILGTAVLIYADYKQVQKNNNAGKLAVTNPNYKPVHIPKEMFVGNSAPDNTDFKRRILAIESMVIMERYNHD